MLRGNYFRAVGDFWRMPLQTAVNPFSAASGNRLAKGLKYSGASYLAFSYVTTPGIYQDTSIISRSTNLATWNAINTGGFTVNDVAASGTNLVVVGTLTSSGQGYIYNFSLPSLNFVGSYAAPGSDVPRYVEWCSGFSRFIISGTNGRAYSTNSAGTNWTYAAYPGSAYAPDSLLYVSDLGRYYDVRVNKVNGGDYIVYSGISATACSAFINYGGYLATQKPTNVKILHKPGINNLLIVDRIEETTGGTLQGVSEYSGSTGVGVGAAASGLPIAKFAGVAYFPSRNLAVVRDVNGELSSFQLDGFSMQVRQNYNAGYRLGSATTSAYTEDSNRIISGPAGLVTLSDEGVLQFNP